MEESDRTNEICFVANNPAQCGHQRYTTRHHTTCCVETNGLCSTLGVVFWKNLSKPSPLFVQQGVSFSVFFIFFNFLFLFDQGDYAREAWAHLLNFYYFLSLSFFLSTFHFFVGFLRFICFQLFTVNCQRLRPRDVCSSTFTFCIRTFDKTDYHFSCVLGFSTNLGFCVYTSCMS